MGKYFASEVAMKVTTDAVQVLGGYGYMRDHSVERFIRDAKCTQIIEGTSEIQKVIIARKMLAFCKHYCPFYIALFSYRWFYGRAFACLQRNSSLVFSV